MAENEITEGVAGMWHYHLRRKGSLKALCGATVMPTSIPLSRWNKPIPDYHLPESFCKECEAMRTEGKAHA